MNEPPYGYDDHTIIPKKQMLAVLDRFEERLKAVQRIFEEHFPGTMKVDEDFHKDFGTLAHFAEELGGQQLALTFVQNLINSYETFRTKPDPETLKAVIAQLKKLRKILSE